MNTGSARTTIAEPFPLPALKRAVAWTKRSSPPPLLTGEVHLWRVVVPDDDDIPPSWHGLLTAEEQERVARKRIALDARRTLASRAGLRILAGDYLGVPPNFLAFTTTAAGKLGLPTPSGSTALEFNVSHSGDWVVLAFAHDLPLGVDIERERALEYGELVNHFFSPQERAAWSAIPIADHARAFFSAWTRKEAYLKALGVGLSKSLDSFSVGFNGDSPCGRFQREGGTSAQRWLLVPVDVVPGYACALAVGSAATALHTFTFDASRSAARSGAE